MVSALKHLISIMRPAGEFAEAVRSQFMEERMDYFRAVEKALYEESGFQVPFSNFRLPFHCSFRGALSKAADAYHRAGCAAFVWQYPHGSPCDVCSEQGSMPPSAAYCCLFLRS